MSNELKSLAEKAVFIYKKSSDLIFVMTNDYMKSHEAGIYAVVESAIEEAKRETSRKLIKTFGKAVHLMRFNSTKEATMICDCKDAIRAYESSHTVVTNEK